MLNVVVPLAGTGIRFLREGYGRPKPFIKALGKELLLWLLENLSLGVTDTLVLVFNGTPDIGPSPKNFFTVIDDALNSTLAKQKPTVVYVCLDKHTVGAAETVLYGIDALPRERIDLPCVLLDGDTFYTHDVLKTFRDYYNDAVNNQMLQSGGCVFVFEDDRPFESPYSYVKTDESMRIIRIQEKSKDGMSSLACSGCYCFYSTDTLRDEIQNAMACFADNLKDVLPKQELYTSSIVAKMLEKGKIFDAIKLNWADFTVLGTPAQLKEFITSKALIQGAVSKRFCFDLDNTLVTGPTITGDYTSCEPISHTIEYVRGLYASGHYIIIHTARRMRTHGGNIGCVIADVGALTIRQLEDFGIPYNEIIFGKPFADFYIDDKAVLPYIDELHKETGIV